ncbi:MAG: mechanosensitive ion channel family protein [Phenylobacterium sp.]|uniref:mechanosensitive ion channel family protein n=1 Tax=Phenylobacterium sp. TaxID=1871053 RepID=UPI00391A19B5
MELDKIAATAAAALESDWAHLAVGLFLVWLAANLVRRFVTDRVGDADHRYKLRKAFTFLSYLAAVLVTAAVFSRQLGGLSVAFGVAGAGIAFALQEVIASVAGWLAIMFGGFFKVGDRVQLGGIKGDVIDIGVLRTTVMQIGEWVDADQYNGRIVRVANSFVFKEPVYNYSADFPFLWDEILVPIKYGSDHAFARRLIQSVAEEVVGGYAREAEAAWALVRGRYLTEPAGVEPVVSLVANENWIAFTLRYVVDYKSRRSTKDRLFTRLLEEIDAAGDRVGVAAATLNIEKLAPLEVRLRPAADGQAAAS